MKRDGEAEHFKPSRGEVCCVRVEDVAVDERGEM